MYKKIKGKKILKGYVKVKEKIEIKGIKGQEKIKVREIIECIMVVVIHLF